MKIEPMSEAEIAKRVEWLTKYWARHSNPMKTKDPELRLMAAWIVATAEAERTDHRFRHHLGFQQKPLCDECLTVEESQRAVAERVGWRDWE